MALGEVKYNTIQSNEQKHVPLEAFEIDMTHCERVLSDKMDYVMSRWDAMPTYISLSRYLKDTIEFN